MDAHRHPDPQRGASQAASRPESRPEFQPASTPRPAYPHPSKEEVRAYMERRKRTRQPPPAPADIRRELGWHSAARTAVVAVAETPAAWGWLPAVFPAAHPAAFSAALNELAAATLLAWLAAFAPSAVLSEKNDKRIT